MTTVTVCNNKHFLIAVKISYETGLLESGVKCHYKAAVK